MLVAIILSNVILNGWHTEPMYQTIIAYVTITLSKIHTYRNSFLKAPTFLPLHNTIITRDEMTTASESGVTIRSLTELDVALSKEVHDHLSAPYEVLYANKETDDACASSARHLDDVLRAMKTAPRTSMCRVNLIRSSKEEVIRSLEQEMSQWISSSNVEKQLSFSVSAHPVLDDVVMIDITSVTTKGRETESLTDNRIPPADQRPVIFVNWPGREKIGWPMVSPVSEPTA
jgi:hypothetical protein